jgi:hypothetical protein
LEEVIKKTNNHQQRKTIKWNEPKSLVIDVVNFWRYFLDERFFNGKVSMVNVFEISFFNFN